MQFFNCNAKNAYFFVKNWFFKNTQKFPILIQGNQKIFSLFIFPIFDAKFLRQKSQNKRIKKPTIFLITLYLLLHTKDFLCTQKIPHKLATILEHTKSLKKK